MIGSPAPQRLDDSIYEAAFVPELWPSALDTISDQCGAAGGLIITGYPQDIRWTSSTVLRQLMITGIADGWMNINSRAPRAAALDHPGFVGDLDLYSLEEIEADPFYGFIRSQGFGWCTGTVITNLDEGFTIFNWERETKDGPFEPSTIRSLDGLRPHLARASLIATRVGLEKARTGAETLNHLGLAAAILSRSGRVLAMNELLEEHIPAVLEDRRERLRLTNARADALFTEALAPNQSTEALSTPRSIPVSQAGDHSPAILHLIPIVRHANDLFGGASWIAVLTVVRPSTAPGHAVVRGLFDLTPAEARVACGVAEAVPLEDIAASAGVSLETVRSQLKHVFGKTGTARQAELVSLLSGLVLPLG
jgi:DNA-binding CsgD family transcriptional regulator